MMRNREKKCRIKITNEINEKLDALEYSNSTDVYEPKKKKDDNFLSLVGEETYFEMTEDDKKRIKKNEKINSIGNKFFNISIFFIVIIGFFIFIGIIFKMSA